MNYNIIYEWNLTRPDPPPSLSKIKLVSDSRRRQPFAGPSPSPPLRLLAAAATHWSFFWYIFDCFSSFPFDFLIMLFIELSSKLNRFWWLGRGFVVLKQFGTLKIGTVGISIGILGGIWGFSCLCSKPINEYWAKKRFQKLWL